MNSIVTKDDLSTLYQPSKDSHKGQNGKLLIIGGSHLFHAASLWSLTVASRIVDLVHYSSVPENNEMVEKAKEEFRNGIVVRRQDVESYIEEDDCILIGPGMTRDSETEEITNTLLKKFPQKQWVIDAGALQMLDLEVIPENAILTPHHREFDDLINRALVANQNFRVLRSASIDSAAPSAQGSNFDSLPALQDQVKLFAKECHCIVLLKGGKDIACSGGKCQDSTPDVEGVHTSGVCIPGEYRVIEGGNPGMTKGGTGDVLAGLIASLACKNDPFFATIAGSYINKYAGDALYKKVGPYFNASDLAGEIPRTMKKLLHS